MNEISRGRFLCDGFIMAFRYKKGVWLKKLKVGGAGYGEARNSRDVCRLCLAYGTSRPAVQVITEREEPFFFYLTNRYLFDSRIAPCQPSPDSAAKWYIQKSKAPIRPTKKPKSSVGFFCPHSRYFQKPNTVGRAFLGHRDFTSAHVVLSCADTTNSPSWK